MAARPSRRASVQASATIVARLARWRSRRRSVGGAGVVMASGGGCLRRAGACRKVGQRSERRASLLKAEPCMVARWWRPGRQAADRRGGRRRQAGGANMSSATAYSARRCRPVGRPRPCHQVAAEEAGGLVEDQAGSQPWGTCGRWGTRGCKLDHLAVLEGTGAGRLPLSDTMQPRAPWVTWALRSEEWFIEPHSSASTCPKATTAAAQVARSC
jgi:hypothetical protein